MSATPHRTLVLGGARSGKSTHAESLLEKHSRVDYVATSAINADDAEWVERIALHRARRPANWRTIETADLAGVLSAAGEGEAEGQGKGGGGEPAVLIDCLGVWLTRMMDECGVWAEDPPAGGPSGRAVLQERVDEFVAALASTRREVVLVSNEVGQGVVPAHWSGRLFRDELGRLNARVAAECERVVFCVAGIPMTLKDTAHQADHVASLAALRTPAPATPPEA